MLRIVYHARLHPSQPQSTKQCSNYSRCCPACHCRIVRRMCESSKTKRGPSQLEGMRAPQFEAQVPSRPLKTCCGSLHCDALKNPAYSHSQCPQHLSHCLLFIRCDVINTHTQQEIKQPLVQLQSLKLTAVDRLSQYAFKCLWAPRPCYKVSKRQTHKHCTLQPEGSMILSRCLCILCTSSR